MNISSRSDTLSLIEEIKSAIRNYSRALPSSTTDTWLRSREYGVSSLAQRLRASARTVLSIARQSAHRILINGLVSIPLLCSWSLFMSLITSNITGLHRPPPDSYPNNPLASHSHLPQVAPGAEPVHSKGCARECVNVKNIRILNSLNILSHIRFQTETRLYTAPPLSDVSLLKGGVYLSQVLITRYTFSFASSSGVYLWKRREGVLWSFSASTD